MKSRTLIYRGSLGWCLLPFVPKFNDGICVVARQIGTLSIYIAPNMSFYIYVLCQLLCSHAILTCELNVVPLKS